VSSPFVSDGLCSLCRSELPELTSPRRRFCEQRCRQAAFRLRRSSEIVAATSRPLVFAYADPPYPGFARRYYRRREVDHEALIASLVAAGYAGWALSTSARALRELLPLCPPRARVCAWVKPIGVSSRTFGLHNTWEPVVVCPGRRLRPGVRDWLSAQPARRGGTLPGRKPLAFCAWLFRILGMRPGDELVDLFPGTGIVSRSWRELSSSSTSGVAPRGPSRPCRSDGVAGVLGR
jgi:hypothetical protein